MKEYIIQVTEINIDQMRMRNDDGVVVEVSYSLMTTDGDVFRSDKAIYWETLPEPLPGHTLPANYKQLPSGIATSLAGLFTTAKVDLETNYGI